MSNWQEFSAKTVDEALTEALIKLETTSDQIEYEVIEKGSTGFLGIARKDAVIKVANQLNISKNTVYMHIRNFKVSSPSN